MQLFFIYDTDYCKADEDDPKDAIVYFSPSMAYETQRYSLCCQLAGVAKFLTSSFSSPTVITLEQGKFAFKQSEKYLLVLGESSEIHNNVLKKQLKHLCNIFIFYHGSISILFEKCNNRRELFVEKLEMIWAHYLRWSQCFGNLLQFSFNALPLSKFTEYPSLIASASHLLQMCQLTSTVIGGTIFYKNRVLSSQLTPEITSYLTLMSNMNTSSVICDAPIIDNLPPGVHLKYIYLTPDEIGKILEYNHKFVGNCFRIHRNEKTPSNSSILLNNITSGSEGDVDSGTGTEYLKSKEESFNFLKKFDNDINRQCHFKFVKNTYLNNYKQKYLKEIFLKNKQSRILKGSQESEVISDDESSHYYSTKNTENNQWKLKKENSLNLNKTDKTLISNESRENDSLNLLDFKFKWDKKHSRSEMLIENTFYSTLFPHGLSSHLLCFHHSSVYASKFLSKQDFESLDSKSSCDMEFSCHLCINKNLNFIYNNLKHWHSEIYISSNKYSDQRETCVFHKNYLNLLDNSPFLKKYNSNRSKNCKIQVLRCRSKSETYTSYGTKMNFISEYSHRNILKNNSSYFHNRKNSFSKKSNIRLNQTSHLNSTRLQKTLLYVQKCGSSNLLLLLNNNYDEKVFSYLWNCGFSVLNDIERDMEKINVDENYQNEFSYNVLLYSADEKILKEDTHSLDSLWQEKHARNCIQRIHEDFQSDINLHSLSLLSSYRNMFACNSKQYSGFYLQTDNFSRKLESLSGLNKKAIHRLNKHFNMTFS